MESPERLTTALNHQEPDRIPYDLCGTTVTGINKRAFIRAMKYRGISTEYDKKEIDPIQQIATPSEETLKYLKSDVRRIGSRRIPDFENILKASDGKREVTDPWGCLWVMDENKDIYYNQFTFPLESFATIREGLKFYNFPRIEDVAEIIKADLAEQLAGIDKSGIIADRNCAGLTETSLRLRGYENWFMDTVTDPEGVEELLEKILEYKFRYWDLVIDWLEHNSLITKINVVSECDDLGTQNSTLLEPEFLRRVVVKRYQRLYSHIRKRMPHVKIFMHTCGAVRVLIPSLIEAGMDILNPVQFTASGMELNGLKKDFGKDLVFWGGGVDTQSTLKNSPPEKVSDEVKRIIDIMAPGGGFVYAPVHNVQQDVPPENFWAMWDTVMEYGKK